MKITKQIAALTVFAFMITQGLPAGWAVANPNDLVTGAVQEKVLTKSATDTETETATAAKVSAPTGVSTTSGAAVDSTTFQMGNGSTLSVAASSASKNSESEVATSTEQAEPAPLPVAPPLGLTNTDKPATLFYTESDWAETMRIWGGKIDEDLSYFAGPLAVYADVRKNLHAFNNLVKDILTSVRKFAGDVWTEFKSHIKYIYVSNMLDFGEFGARISGSSAFSFNPAKIGSLLQDRRWLTQGVLHESFHLIGSSLDRSLGFLSGVLGNRDNEGSTDARAIRTQERIANSSANERGWREVFGDELTLQGDRHYFVSKTEKDGIYTIDTNASTGERTVNRFSYANLDWSRVRVSGDYMDVRFRDNLVFHGQSEVYRADNTLARIIQYEKNGKGVRPDGTNKLVSITHYDASGTLKTSSEEYVYAAGDRYQITLKNSAGEILSAKWFQTVNGKPVELPLGWNLPINIVATAPTSAGVVTLSGKRASDTSIWYSLDGGVTYKQFVVAGSNVAWASKITLPVGTTTISLIARTTAVVPGSGLTTTISSEPVVLAPITYAAPTVDKPTVAATAPTAEGVVTLSGPRPANNSMIWYSINGSDYKPLSVSKDNRTWTGRIVLTVGPNVISVISRITVDVSGVSTTISSEAAILGPIIFVPAPQVTAPAATSTKNSIVLNGTKAAGESLWISADGGLTYALLVENNTSTTWSASQPLVPGANNFKIIAKDASLNPSAVVTLPTITYDPFCVLDQPPLRYTQAERNATANEWSAFGGKMVGVDSNVAQIILDALTTLRLYMPDYWGQFKSRIFKIQNGATTQGSNVGAEAQVSTNGTNGYLILGPAFFAKNANGSVDQTRIADKRFDLLEHIIHEGYHVIGNRMDAKIGMASTDLLVEVGENPSERFAEWRAMKTIQAIAKNGGWDEVYGNNEYHFTSNNEAYQIVYSQSDPTHYTKVYYRFGDLNFDAARFWKSGLTATQRQTIKNTFWCYYSSRRSYYLNLKAFFATGLTVTGSEIYHV